MAVTPEPAPFEGGRYDIAPGVSLALIEPSQAVELGTMFASIDPWARYPVSADQLAKFFAADEAANPRFAILQDGALVGAICVRLNWFRGPYIQTFALAPSVQGHGIGTAAIAWVEREARAGGDRNLWVAASGFNTSAQRFYARHGFAPVATIDGLLQDGIDEILMRKRLYVTSEIARQS
jgi:diamine N-acetyltransferase